MPSNDAERSGLVKMVFLVDFDPAEKINKNDDFGGIQHPHKGATDRGTLLFDNPLTIMVSESDESS